MLIRSVFPDGLGIVDNSDIEIDKESLLSTLCWKTDINDLGQFDQSQTDLHNSLEWNLLLSWIKKQAIAYWKTLGWKCNDLWFTQAWVNSMSRGGEIDWHYHSNSMISGVYYFKVTEFSGGTIFKSTKNPLETMIQTEFDSFTEYTAGEIIIPAKEDRLVLFPSYINHKSEKNKIETDRYTLAFNMLPDQLGKENHFNWVKFN